MNANLVDSVRARAANRCEYCRLPQELLPFARFTAEPILPILFDGTNNQSNLALVCTRCNRFRHGKRSGLDPVTHQVSPLFNPRVDRWDEHFEYRAGYIVGQTFMGRATVHVFVMNAPDRVRLRAMNSSMSS